MLGIWKSFDELEDSISMPELFHILDANRERRHEDQRFFAAIQGIDMDEAEDENRTTWEDIKARAFSGGLAKDASDILALSGKNAQLKGFGIGNGLDYFNSDSAQWWDE